MSISLNIYHFFKAKPKIIILILWNTQSIVAMYSHPTGWQHTRTSCSYLPVTSHLVINPFPSFYPCPDSPGYRILILPLAILCWFTLLSIMTSSFLPCCHRWQGSVPVSEYVFHDINAHSLFIHVLLVLFSFQLLWTAHTWEIRFLFNILISISLRR